MAFYLDYFLDYSLEVFVNYFLGSLVLFCLEDYCLGSDTFLWMLILDLFDYHFPKNFLGNYFLLKKVDLWQVWEVLKVFGYFLEM